MPDAQELQSVVEAAEQAAAAGDYASAERLLREVASLQEASLGALHPDLANTLNNLGVVCEITGKDADAEQFFRRSSSIAAAALPPDHPFVATSRKNLEDFCDRARQACGPADRAGTIRRASPGSAHHGPDPTEAIRATGGARAIRNHMWHRRHPTEGCRHARSPSLAPFSLVFLIAAAAWLRSPRRTGSSSPSPTATQSAPSATRAAVSLQSRRECSTQGNRVHERSAGGRRAKDTSTHRARSEGLREARARCRW